MRPSWNYVLALRYHHDTLVELRPNIEAPPQNLTRRVHGITSMWWGTTMSSHYRGHGIMSYPNLIHALPTNHEFPMHTNSMSFHINNQSSNISHAKLTTNSLIPTHNIRSTCISTLSMFKTKQTSQSNNQQHSYKEKSKNPS